MSNEPIPTAPAPVPPATCNACRRAPATEGYKTCQPCRQKRTENFRVWTQKKREREKAGPILEYSVYQAPKEDGKRKAVDGGDSISDQRPQKRVKTAPLIVSAVASSTVSTATDSSQPSSLTTGPKKRVKPAPTETPAFAGKTASVATVAKSKRPATAAATSTTDFLANPDRFQRFNFGIDLYTTLDSLYCLYKSAPTKPFRFYGTHSIVADPAVNNKRRARAIERELKAHTSLSFDVEAREKHRAVDGAYTITHKCTCSGKDPCPGLIWITIIDDNSHAMGWQGQRITVSVTHPKGDGART
ncbi:hypothetical protein MKEN_00455200 [Mycena kentingensis (nom. inval.)]|nr:hypothetical protein MKEN_00455200 [Mycena kentingensis (nom. inval.)]